MSEQIQQQEIIHATPEISAKIQDFAEKIKFSEPNWIALCDCINFREAQTHLLERQQEASSVPSEENSSLLRVAENDFSLAKLEVLKNERDIGGYRQASDSTTQFEIDIAGSYQDKFPNREPKNYWFSALDTMKQIQNSIFSPGVGQIQTDKS